MRRAKPEANMDCRLSVHASEGSNDLPRVPFHEDLGRPIVDHEDKEAEVRRIITLNAASEC